MMTMKFLVKIQLLFCLFVTLAVSFSCEAFSPVSPTATILGKRATTMINMDMNGAFYVPDLPLSSSLSNGLLNQSPLSSSPSIFSTSSVELSTATLDPTTILSDIFGMIIGTPIILFVPIIVALGVAGILVFGIVSYANPEVEDDEI